MPFETVIFEKDGAVAVLSLNRPEKLNAYNMQMRDDLYEALCAVRDDPEVRAMILRGEGRAFSTGGDVEEFGLAPSPVKAREARWRRDVWGTLLALEQPTLAAVHGFAAGGGMEMALLCDFCLAAENAVFFLPETSLGMIPGVGGTQTAPRAIGIGRAMDMVLTNRRIDAREALRIGLVNRVVPHRRLMAEAKALARRLAGLAPEVVAAAKRAVRGGQDLTLAAGLELERRLLAGLARRS
jgi:enoyl-CoA hydratase/carnithine racemase